MMSWRSLPQCRPKRRGKSADWPVIGLSMKAGAAMTKPVSRRSFAMTGCAALAVPAMFGGAITLAQAQQGYPNRPIRFVLAFGAGGVADIAARIVAEKLGEKLGQRIVVENQPGAGGIAAARTVLSAPPDGYTLALLTNGTAISVGAYNALPFDPVKDFAPVS